MNSPDPAARLEELTEAIRRHREEKASTPDCTCWVSPAQGLDAALYALLDKPGSAAERVPTLEDAIRRNREGKKGVPDCPCWGNAPQIIDAELFRTLEDKP